MKPMTLLTSMAGLLVVTAAVVCQSSAGDGSASNATVSGSEPQDPIFDASAGDSVCEPLFGWLDVGDLTLSLYDGFDADSPPTRADAAIPPGGDGTPHSDDNVDPDAAQDSLAEGTLSVLPRVDEYWDSGCLEDPNGTRAWPDCGDDEIELTVDGSTLHVLHRNVAYNCCPDDIVISLSVEGSILHLTEEEILTLPCPCICCYDVEATVVDLAPGAYVVEFCWYDYDTGGVECYVENIVIP